MRRSRPIHHVHDHQGLRPTPSRTTTATTVGVTGVTTGVTTGDVTGGAA